MGSIMAGASGYEDGRYTPSRVPETPLRTPFAPSTPLHGPGTPRHAPGTPSMAPGTPMRDAMWDPSQQPTTPRIADTPGWEQEVLDPSICL